MGFIEKKHTDATAIEWVLAVARAQGKRAAVWNPLEGCKAVSAGCRNCWAARNVHFRGGQSGAIGERFGGLTRKTASGRIVFTGRVRKIKRDIAKPARTKAPTVYFVCSRSDLFGMEVSDDLRSRVFEKMKRCSRHTFLVLTKRPERMRDYILRIEQPWPAIGRPWPLANVWLGVSVEDQAMAEARIPALLETPAAVRFISAEPLLAAVDLTRLDTGTGYGRTALRLPSMSGGPNRSLGNRLDWIICGGESGPGARPMHPDWPRGLRDQCAAAGVPFFFKQWGGTNKKAHGRDLDGRIHAALPEAYHAGD